MNLGLLIAKCERWIKVNSPTILSVVGAAGVIGTAVVTNVMTKKIEDKRKEISEKSDNGEYSSDAEEGKAIIKEVVPLYLPIAGMTILTIGCVFGANILGMRRQRELMGALASTTLLFNTYRNKVKEELGEVKEQEIYQQALAELPKSTDEIIEFYDPVIDYTFYASWSDFITSQYLMNKLYLETGEMRLNELYLMLPHKLQNIPEKAKDMGWYLERMNDMYGDFWIPFAKRKVLAESSKNGYFIEICWPYGPTNLERDDE